MNTHNNIDIVYQMVTERFVTALEAGVAPWQKPWGIQGRAGITAEPRNIASRKAYRGINLLLLGFGSNFESRYWGTFNQIRELGGHVKAGSQSSIVVFFKRMEKKDKSGQPVLDALGRPAYFPMIRYSRVFNLDQTEGIKDPDADAIAKAKADAAKAAKKVTKKVAKKDPAIARAEAVAPVCKVEHGGDRACYSVVLDVVRMPAKESFKGEANYHHTLFHEFAHATGHSTRINRESLTSSTAFGSEVYSKEELVAEITASFVGSHVGILNEVIFNNSAAYLGSWLKKLKDDPKLIVQAASAAQRASDLILGLTPEAPVES